MNALHALTAQLRILRRKQKSRRDLARRLHDMNSQELDALVRDVGIPHSDLMEEASRPLWSANRSQRTDSPIDAEPVKPPMPGIRAVRA